MQMGLALPMAYYFHRATTIGLPANIAVVPLTQLLMPAAILTISLGYISPLLAKFPRCSPPARSQPSLAPCMDWAACAWPTCASPRRLW